MTDETTDRTGIALKTVTIPVFPSTDPVGRLSALTLAGQRNMQVSIRGERIIDRVVEKTLSHEELSRQLPVDELLQILKVKMFNESIPDQRIYDLLFEDRLEKEWERQWARRQLTPARHVTETES